MNIDPTKRYSRKDAAAAIGKSTDSLDRYTKAGMITAHVSRLNGRRWWKGSDLIRLINI